ncbi:hypothetical protein H5410_029802 [Solanum commersonii]|uniref:Uncharacterized protein n=1 Tax=Solanum commersonii TaxID=4109 RepID=A0A9J5YFN1_SOLCO|nr:hypothetical protein H5410_029802 [Solanum commersonii]
MYAQSPSKRFTRGIPLHIENSVERPSFSLGLTQDFGEVSGSMSKSNTMQEIKSKLKNNPIRLEGMSAKSKQSNIKIVEGGKKDQSAAGSSKKGKKKQLIIQKRMQKERKLLFLAYWSMMRPAKFNSSLHLLTSTAARTENNSREAAFQDHNEILRTPRSSAMPILISSDPILCRNQMRSGFASREEEENEVGSGQFFGAAGICFGGLRELVRLMYYMYVAVLLENWQRTWDCGLLGTNSDWQNGPDLGLKRIGGYDD